MSKKEEFKEFVRNHEELNKYVNQGKMTWQKFYEMYDLYGEEHQIWNEYLGVDRKLSTSIKDIPNLIKNIDMDSIQTHIGTAQKALSLIQEITTKGTATAGAADILSKGPKEARPINKFFED